WNSVSGIRPNGIIQFLDVIRHQGALYAAVTHGFSTNRRQVRRSNDEGVTWPDVLLDNESSAVRPVQLASNGDHLLVLTLGSEYIYTSADGFAEAHATGFNFSSAAGRMIESASGLFFILGIDPVIGPAAIFT